jgi:chitin disaccharide deacetylase
MYYNKKLSKNERYLIINADDFGMCNSSNEAVIRMFNEGAITSSTLMMPCPKAKEAAFFASEHPDKNVGVHLTFTSEWSTYKWGPLSNNEEVPSLLKGQYFPESVIEVEQNASEEHVLKEIIKQIESAKELGVMPTHLDNHMGSLYGVASGKSFLPIVFDICAKYNLPFRFPRKLTDDELSQSIRGPLREIFDYFGAVADQKGVPIIDYLHSHPFELTEGEDRESFKEAIMRKISKLESGISEIFIHPAFATEELKFINPQWEKRQIEFDVFMDEGFRRFIEKEGIKLISYKDLKNTDI